MTDDNELAPDPELLSQQMAISEMIATKGRAICYIEKEGSMLAFAYTIGNHEKGYPELFLLGESPEVCDGLLNGMSKTMIRRKRALVDGELLKRNKIIKAVTYECTDAVKLRYTAQIGEHYQTQDYKLFQVVLADAKGHCPPDARTDPKFQVPVYRKLILNS